MQHHRPNLRAGHGNRRRRPPAQAAARRHFAWLLAQARRLGLSLRRLPQRLRGRIAWRPTLTGAGDALAGAGNVVAERGRALAPAARRAFAGLGKRMGSSADGLGRTAVAARRGAGRLGRLTVRGLDRLGRAAETGGRALARLGGRLARAGARFSVALARALWERRAGALGLAQRLAWWGALALLWYGGRAVIDLRAPLVDAAFPLFLAGLALCLPLFFARAARLRWSGLALGLGHAALAVAVWTLAAPA